MKTTRNNVFETNSSSSHSISIGFSSSGKIDSTMLLETDGSLEIPYMSSSCFLGCNNPVNKAACLDQYLRYSDATIKEHYEDLEDEGENKENPYLNFTEEYKEEKLKLLYSTIKNFTGATKVKCATPEKRKLDDSPLDYCDADDYGEGSSFNEAFGIFDKILQNEETIRKFIFSSSNYLEQVTTYDY